MEFAKRFTKGKHAFIVCTHIDKAHVHNHIIWSSVNLDCDRKFRNFWGSTKAVRHLSDTLCIENGLSIVENPKPHGKSYDQWLGDQAKPSHRELLRAAIDNALAKKPTDLDELLKLLRESGCEVSKRGKSYRLKLPGWGIPFCKVSAEYAYKEGEDDRSLEKWREVHRRAFAPDYKEAGLDFDENEDCVLEEFAVVFRSENIRGA